MGNFNDCFNTKSILFLNLRNTKTATNIVNNQYNSSEKYI